MNPDVLKPPPPNLTDHLILASPILAGSIFEKAVILITEKTPAGHEGYIINHQSTEILGDIFSRSKGTILDSIPVHIGGPVHTDKLNFLAIHSSLEAGFSYKANIKFEEAEALFMEENTQVIPCLGYSGWSPGQLENEFEQHTWYHCRPPLDLAERSTKIGLWTDLLFELSPYHSLIALAPPSPMKN